MIFDQSLRRLYIVNYEITFSGSVAFRCCLANNELSPTDYSGRVFYRIIESMSNHSAHEISDDNDITVWLHVEIVMITAHELVDKRFMNAFN